MIKNAYSSLRKENDLSTSTLQGENQVTLRNICDFLETITWNHYEIERIRKDLIDISARCELEGRTLQEEIGGDPEAFLLELAPDLPRGTPMDSVSTWYPGLYLFIALMHLFVFVVDHTAKDDLVSLLLSPFFWLVWVYIGSWFWHRVLFVKVRRGILAALPFGLLTLAFYIAFLFGYYWLIVGLPHIMVNELFSVAYYFFVAAVSKCWQVIRYNRYAARYAPNV